MKEIITYPSDRGGFYQRPLIKEQPKVLFRTKEQPLSISIRYGCVLKKKEIVSFFNKKKELI